VQYLFRFDLSIVQPISSLLFISFIYNIRLGSPIVILKNVID
jgi:hypothetical protein